MALLALFSLRLEAQEAGASSVFDSDNVWKYRFVDVPDKIDTSNSIFEITNFELNVEEGKEERDGQRYYKLAWNCPEEYPGTVSSCFLLREEEGAYYTYLEYPEDTSLSPEMVRPGEYLVYDFGMDIGTSFEAPYRVLYHSGIGPLDGGGVAMALFTVKEKRIDEEGRRVLGLTCEVIRREENCGMTTGLLPESVMIVEGVGFVMNGNPAISMFPEGREWSYLPMVELSELTDSEGNVEFINPVEEHAGFVREKDYTWVYGVYDSEGSLSYHRMGFNYFYRYYDDPLDPAPVYRRFGTLGISDTPDGEWRKVDFACFQVRESDGKVWLRHWEDSENINVSLLYDFTADDSEPLTFYTPDGERTRDIINGLTEVGGEELRSYTFEGSDGVKSVKGLGIVKGGILPCVNTEFRLPTSKDDDTYCGAVLVAVYDGEGKLIYSQDMPEAIGEIPGSEDGWLAPDQRIFDLQGRELAEPVPGRPYIRDGKVLVEPK